MIVVSLDVRPLFLAQKCVLGDPWGGQFTEWDLMTPPARLAPLAAEKNRSMGNYKAKASKIVMSVPVFMTR